MSPLQPSVIRDTSPFERSYSITFCVLFHFPWNYKGWEERLSLSLIWAPDLSASLQYSNHQVTVTTEMLGSDICKKAPAVSAVGQERRRVLLRSPRGWLSLAMVPLTGPLYSSHLQQVLLRGTPDTNCGQEGIQSLGLSLKQH